MATMKKSGGLVGVGVLIARRLSGGGEKQRVLPK